VSSRTAEKPCTEGRWYDRDCIKLTRTEANLLIYKQFIVLYKDGERCTRRVERT